VFDDEETVALIETAVERVRAVGEVFALVVHPPAARVVADPAT
jgi:hypothetical protein